MPSPTRSATAAAATTAVAALLAVAGCTSQSGGAGAEGPQRAVLEMHPQIAQPGDRPASAEEAQSAMTASLKPARKGRAVVLERREGSGWTTVDRAEEDAKGVAEFTAPYAVDGEPATYRVTAKATDGLDAVSSSAEDTSQFSKPDFSDEFAGTELGSDWVNRLQGYSAESKRKCSKADPRAVQVGQGVLQLSDMADPDRTGERCQVDGKDYAWRINGHIGTVGTRSFTYGYAAARIKFQPLRGQHGAFWMQPASREAEEGPATKTGAEIDVVEWFGDDDPHGGLTSFVYYYPDDGGPGVTGKKVGGYVEDPERFGSDWSSKYHVFSVEWTPSEYVFRIDGKETFRTSQGVSGRPEFLILSMLSSDYELPWMPDESKLPQTMDVDWVRYWETR